MEGLVNLRGETQWEDLSLLPDKASPRKSGSSNHIMHVSRYITNEMEVMLDQFWFWSASPTFPYFRHDFSDKISSNCGIPWIFHGFSNIFLPSSSADAVTPSRRQRSGQDFAQRLHVHLAPQGPWHWWYLLLFLVEERFVGWKKTQTSMDLSMQEQLWFNLMSTSIAYSNVF